MVHVFLELLLLSDLVVSYVYFDLLKFPCEFEVDFSYDTHNLILTLFNSSNLHLLVFLVLCALRIRIFLNIILRPHSPLQFVLKVLVLFLDVLPSPMFFIL